MVPDCPAPLGDITVVRLPAEVDLESSGAVRDELLATVNRGTHLVVDATGVTFMDSSGINALLRASERAERLSGSLHVVSASRPVRRVLEITQLDRVLAVVETMEDAQECLASPATIHSCREPR